MTRAELIYRGLKNAKSWRDLYALCRRVGIIDDPEIKRMILTDSEEFKLYVNILLENGFQRFFTRMSDFIRKSDWDCECVIRITNGYADDYIRPATYEDLEYFRDLAAQKYFEKNTELFSEEVNIA